MRGEEETLDGPTTRKGGGKEEEGPSPQPQLVDGGEVGDSESGFARTKKVQNYEK